MSVREGESRHPWPGPLSRTGPGERPLFRGRRGHRATALAAKHLQGNRGRPRPSGVARSRSFALGAAGRVAAQRHADRARGAAGSHQNKGWEHFTDAAVRALRASARGWCSCCGAITRDERAQVSTAHKHLVLECAHPSPLSAHNGFFGCRHFSKANDYLVAQGQTPIEW